MVIIIVAILLIIGLAIHDDRQEHDVPKLSAQEACVKSNARPLPTAATITSIRDDRLGLIYPCYYLLDLGIVPGQTTALMGGLQESTFTEESFRGSSSWSGWLILGSGTARGSAQAEQTTTHRNLYAFRAQTTDGDYSNFVIDAKRVHLNSCADPCQPSVRFTVTNDPLFTKLKDEHRSDSIWLARSGTERSAALRSLSVITEQDKGQSITGGPRFPGEVVEALAKVVVTLPASLAPTPLR